MCAAADPRRALRSGMPASAPTAAANGRTRRAAVFNAAAAAGKGLAPGSDDEDEESNGVVGSEAEDGSEGEDAEMDEIEEEEQEEDEGKKVM